MPMIIIKRWDRDSREGITDDKHKDRIVVEERNSITGIQDDRLAQPPSLDIYSPINSADNPLPFSNKQDQYLHP